MKITLILNDDFSFWQFRRGLVSALVSRGIDVTIITPDGPFVTKLRELGARHVIIPMNRFISPSRDLMLCWSLYRALRSIRPDIVHNMTIKPNLYGAIAARMAGVPTVVGLVSGLGYSFLDGGGIKARFLRTMIKALYAVACRLTDRLWFQNEDDLSLFIHSGIIEPEKAVLIRSGGIDTKEYSPASSNVRKVDQLRADIGIESDAVVVLMMVARVVWSKGVREFTEASREAATWPRKTFFLLVGPLDHESPEAVPEGYLRAASSPSFSWIGFHTEIKELLTLSDIVALPSYYREGVPRVLLEALAMEKPIVTTDNVGCRDVVDEGKNGIIVPIKNSPAFAQAVASLVASEAMRISYGRHSRVKAETEFQESIVIKQVFERLYKFTV